MGRYKHMMMSRNQTHDDTISSVKCSPACLIKSLPVLKFILEAASHDVNYPDICRICKSTLIHEVKDEKKECKYCDKGWPGPCGCHWYKVLHITCETCLKHCYHK